jgi:hypothetical protein
MKYNIFLVLAISAIVMTLVIPLQSFSVLDKPNEKPVVILRFDDCNTKTYSPNIPLTKSIYVFEGILGNNIELNNTDQKDISIHISNLDNLKNFNDTKVDGSVWITQKNLYKSLGFTLTNTYLKCASDFNEAKEGKSMPLTLPISYNCDFKDIYIKGITSSKLSQKEGIQPSKTFSLELHSKLLEPASTSSKPTNSIWGYMNLGHNFVSLSNLKIDAACISP